MIASAVYRLGLSLWVGGMALFTFVVTPVIFRTQGRERRLLLRTRRSAGKRRRDLRPERLPRGAAAA